MKAKEFTFTMEFNFIADNEKDAIKQMQDELDNLDWDNGLLQAKNWNVEVEDVDVSTITGEIK
jgi:hypothetical protein